MQYKSGKDNPPFPSKLRHYRELAQENHLRDYNQKLHIGILEAGADIGHQYWEMMEHGTRNARLNIKRGICLALQKYIHEFTGMDIDAIVNTVFPPIPVKVEPKEEQEPEQESEPEPEPEPVIPAPMQGDDKPEHEIKEVQVEEKETEEETSEETEAKLDDQTEEGEGTRWM